MDLERNHMNQHYDLPLHRPSMDLWDRIEGELEFLDMVQIYGLNLNDLPEHGPDHLTWQNIEDRLPVTPVYERTYFKISRTILALGLLVFFAWIISRLIPGTVQQSQIIPTENDINLENTLNKATQNQSTENRTAKFDPSAVTGKVSGTDKQAENAITAETSSKENSGTVAEKMNSFTIPGNSSHKQKADISPAVTGRNKAGEISSAPDENNTNSFENTTAVAAIPVSDSRSLDYSKMSVYGINRIKGYGLSSPGKPDARTKYFVNKYRTIEIGLNERMEINELPGGFPSGTYVSSTPELNIRIGFKGFFVESGIGYKQFDVENQYGLNYYKLNYLGSVLVMNEYQIIQYVNSDGEIVVEKIYHPRLVNVFDTTAVVTPTTATSHYKYLEIPVFIGKQIYSRNIWSLNVITGVRLNFPLKTVEVLPNAGDQSFDYVNIDRVATMGHQFYAQFFAGIENKFLLTNWLNFSLEPSFSYNSQKMTLDNMVVQHNGFSFGLRAGLSVNIK